MGHRQRRSVALVSAVVALGAAAFALGRSAATLAPDPIVSRDGVPTGVDHSPGGAVAAADEYLATEQATVERNPARFSALVANDYVTSLRASALAGAVVDRGRDPDGMKLWAGGGQSFTVIGADRLDWYGRDGARVTTWAGQVFWGPRQRPTQAWSLGEITLAWREGRWQVAAMGTLPIAAPAPAVLPQAAPADDDTSVFSRELAGFSAVGYGSPG
jgi:hypothetical protein